MPAGDAIERLVGLQAQNPRDPYLGLWSRLDGFKPEELAGLIESRQAVRISLLRSTIHLVSDRDCLAIRPLLQPSLERGLYTATPWGRMVEGVDTAELAAAARALLEAEPMTFAELGRRLAERWPERDPAALGYAAREYVPMVQVPPRGLWERSGRALHTPAEHWLGQAMAGCDPAELVRRYLAAFGPATAADFGAWSGIAGARSLIPHGLTSFRDARGRELLDVPGAALPAADAAAPVRFLPTFDNILLGHADRGRIIPDGMAPKWLIGKPSVLVGGFVAAVWKLEPAALVISPVRSLLVRERRDVLREARALLELLGRRPVRLD